MQPRREVNKPYPTTKTVYCLLTNVFNTSKFEENAELSPAINVANACLATRWIRAAILITFALVPRPSLLRLIHWSHQQHLMLHKRACSRRHCYLARVTTSRNPNFLAFLAFLAAIEMLTEGAIKVSTFCFLFIRSLVFLFSYSSLQIFPRNFSLNWNLVLLSLRSRFCCRIFYQNQPINSHRSQFFKYW